MRRPRLWPLIVFQQYIRHHSDKEGNQSDAKKCGPDVKDMINKGEILINKGEILQ